MNFKKITSALSAMAVSAGMLSALPTAQSSAALDINYAEALQKSLFFYEVQQAGVLPEWNQVSWRADSMENDEVPGGWFDAGDHLKFTLTNAYSAMILGWGLYQYKDAVKEAGLYDRYLLNLKWGLDYVSACDRGDSVIGTIGDDAFDHKWWGSAEVYMRKYVLQGGEDPRPYDEIECTTVVADMASALAFGYLILKDEDPTTAEKYLTQAKDLFKRADAHRSNDGQGVQKGYYNIQQSGTDDDYVDELMVAANILYMATGEQSYLDLCESDYIPIFPLENQSTDRKFTWGLCWDDVSQMAALLYAQNTGKEEWVEHVKHHLEYWTTGYNGKQVSYTPDGHAWLFNWGSMRHMANTVMIAKIACDTVLKDDAASVSKYDTWSKEQFDYAFGDNALGLSYVIGMGEKNAVNVHHRTTSGIHDDHWNSLGGSGTPTAGEEWQTEYAHVLYGALEGGPTQDGSFKDENAAYEHTEVAIDYNAGFTGALCAFIAEEGGEPLADFPPIETPKWDEWKMAAVLNGSGASYTEVKAWAMNHTAWPARVYEDVKYRYFFDVSEVLAAGLSIDDITFETKAQQYSEGEAGYGTANGIHKYEGDPTGNTYYAEIAFEDGRAIMPTGQSEHRDEVQFRVSIPDAIDGKPTTGAWDPSNDWSYEGIEDADNIKTSAAYNRHITMYVNDILVWGTEPDGTTAVPGADIEGGTVTPPTTTVPPTKPPVTTTTQPTTKPVEPTTKPEEPTGGNDKVLYGDANCDGVVTIADAAAVLQSIGNADKYSLSEQGQTNADVNGQAGITPDDAIVIMKVDAEMIKQSELPLK
ncbi:MAG: glycoside hydrolase family 9 protein [Ruminococcus sp.]|nr:glycoside hydrolase family 9 protein [Ruminococcus sp.]